MDFPNKGALHENKQIAEFFSARMRRKGEGKRTNNSGAAAAAGEQQRCFFSPSLFATNGRSSIDAGRRRIHQRCIKNFVGKKLSVTPFLNYFNFPKLFYLIGGECRARNKSILRVSPPRWTLFGPLSYDRRSNNCHRIVATAEKTSEFHK